MSAIEAAKWFGKTSRKDDPGLDIEQIRFGLKFVSSSYTYSKQSQACIWSLQVRHLVWF
jgi:hypothetical protein